MVNIRDLFIHCFLNQGLIYARLSRGVGINVRNKLLLPGYRKHSIHVRYSYSYSSSSVDMDYYKLLRVIQRLMVWENWKKKCSEELECGECVWAWLCVSVCVRSRAQSCWKGKKRLNHVWTACRTLDFILWAIGELLKGECHDQSCTVDVMAGVRRMAWREGKTSSRKMSQEAALMRLMIL